MRSQGQEVQEVQESQKAIPEPFSLSPKNLSLSLSHTT